MSERIRLVDPATGQDYRAGGAQDASGNTITQMAALPAGTNRSGTIAAGGAAQQLAPANTGRRGLYGQNISDGDLWVNEIGGAAAVSTAGSYRVVPGGSFSVSTNRAISIIGATAGQAFSATEF